MNGSRYVYIKVTVREQNIEIIVQDYGIGIANIEQASTPTYTTREDEHAGMGFTIMQALSDKLEVRSSLGIGTKIIIHKELAGDLLEVE